MRILEVIHDYLPLHAAGSEIYTAHLCRALVDAGHDVAVFTTEQHPDREQFTLVEREHDGVPVHEGVYNHIYADVSEHWDDPQMAAAFERVLERVRPDVVHVQGMQFVGGVSMLEWTRALVGAPAYGATECEGALLDEAEWDQSATSYCAAEMDGKAFQGPDGSSGVEMR